MACETGWRRWSALAAGGHLRVARDLVRGCVAGLCKVLLCCCYGGGCGVRHGDRAWTGPQRAALLDHVRLSPCTTHQHQQHLTARGSARTSLRRGARYYGAGVAAASASTAPGPAHPPRVLAPRSAPAASASSLSLCLAPRHTLSCASRVAKKLCQRASNKATNTASSTGVDGSALGGARAGGTPM